MVWSIACSRISSSWRASRRIWSKTTLSWRSCDPTMIVGEFSQMLHDAIDLSQELRNLQRFALNFADEPDIVIPTPYPELSRRRVLTMSLISGAPFSRSCGVEETGWDVEALVRRAADAYLEMIFRDSLYHADPQPGNLLLPDGSHIAILDFGDVGRISSMRKRQLEDLVIAAGTHDLDGFIDVIVEITTPPPSVDMNRLRSQIDVWLNRYLLIGVGQSRHGCDHQHGHASCCTTTASCCPADLSLLFRVMLQLQGLGRGLQHGSPSHRVAPAVHEEVAGRTVRPAASRPPRRTNDSSAGTVWPHPCPATSRRSSSRSAPVNSASTSVSTMPDGAVDHLVDGLVAAAAVLASAQLISRRTGPTVGSISVPGAVAAGVGVLTWQRLVRRRRERKTWVSRARELADLRGRRAES